MEWFGVLFEWMDDIILLSFGADSQVNSHAQNHRGGKHGGFSVISRWSTSASLKVLSRLVLNLLDPILMLCFSNVLVSLLGKNHFGVCACPCSQACTLFRSKNLLVHIYNIGL
jgi:hypothetical protein